jgi:C1A family cysteine protease
VYKWKRDKLDNRDLKYKGLFKPIKLPPSVDLRNNFKLPEPYDQGEIGSCTANSLAFAYQYEEIKQNNIDSFMPSRLFIYYNERELEGTEKEDSGASLRDGMKTINKNGVCNEQTWPYNVSNLFIKPTLNCYEEGKKYHTILYSSINQNLSELKTAIVNNDPFVFGFQVYDSFNSDDVKKTGLMPVPDPTKEQLLGGHAVTCVGYDDTKDLSDGKKGAFIIRNSWGLSWGDKGHFYMPYSVITNKELAGDFWVVKKVTKPEEQNTLWSTITDKISSIFH